MVKVSWKDRVGGDVKNPCKGNTRLKTKESHVESEK